MKTRQASQDAIKKCSNHIVPVQSHKGINPEAATVCPRCRGSVQETDQKDRFLSFLQPFISKFNCDSRKETTNYRNSVKRYSFDNHENFLYI